MLSLRFPEGDGFPPVLDGDPVVDASVRVLAHAFCSKVKVEPVGDFGRGESGDSGIDFASWITMGANSFFQPFLDLGELGGDQLSGSSSVTSGDDCGGS